MIGKREYLADYVQIGTGSVSFGDGVKNKVLGFGTLTWKECPN